MGDICALLNKLCPQCIVENVYDTNGYDSLAFMWICDNFFDRHAIWLPRKTFNKLCTI
jgi:hypothetical protein